MPTYQFLLHTTGIRLEDAYGKPTAIGFFTSKRAYASSSEDAYKIVMASMDADPTLADIFESAHRAGLSPKTEVEEMYIIPWWRTILPWTKPGLALYSEDSEDESISKTE